MSRRARWLLLPVLLLGACGMKTLDPVVAIEAGPDGGTTPPSTIENGLVAHWTFDETDGDTVHDIAGNPPHDGTKSGGTWQADGRFKGALSLLRDQHVEILGFPQATSSFTVSLWVRFKPGDIGASRATLISNQVSAMGSQQAGGWEVNAPDGANPARLEFAYPLRDTPQSSSNWVHLKCCVAVSDSWTHITAMIDGPKQSVTVYEGEILQGTMPSVAAIRPGSDPLYMGAELTERANSNFQGTLDEIRIYNRTLTLDEIRLLDKAP